MTKKQIEKLALLSFTGNNLDNKKIGKLINYISRSDLKMYLQALKNLNKKQTVEIFIPSEAYKKNLKLDMIKHAFPKKNIKFSIDSTLLTGIKIVSDDLVYDFNLKNTLEDIVSHIRKQYD